MFGCITATLFGTPAIAYIADLARDQHLLPEIEQTAALLLNNHPDHVPSLIRRWLGEGEQYAEV